MATTKLTFIKNINKIKFMKLCVPQKTINPLQLKIEHIQIECWHEFNFLGLTINEHLDWRDQIYKSKY